MSRRAESTLALLAGAYELTSHEDGWLQSLSDAALPLMDAGYGTFAFKTDLRASRIVSFVASGGPPWVRDCITGLQAAANPDEMATATGTVSRYVTLSQSFGRQTWLGLEITRRHVLPYGVEDAASINVLDPAGRFLFVVGSVRRKAAPPSRVDVAHFNRVSSHLVAAYRLRERLRAHGRADPSVDADGEAVLAPSGAVEHATAQAADRSARDVLREAVRDRERALASAAASSRASGWREPLDLWKGLVEGRWSLVDRFDSDGRRYVVAHANNLAAPGPRALTEQERDVAALAATGLPIKLIAYELGLSVPRVSNVLRVAMTKIGASSRAELVRIYAAAREAHAIASARDPLTP